MFGKDIGIDLGTVSTVVYVPDRGVVLQQPSLVAVQSETDQVVAVGDEAADLLGSAPADIVGVRPLADGVIADLSKTEIMLSEFLRRALAGQRGLLRPRVAICVPAAVTTVERRAVVAAALAVGARRVLLIEEPVAAALGAGLDIWEPRGHLVVDIGGGTTDTAVLSLGGVVVSESIRTGGNAMDAAIVRYVRSEWGLNIGAGTAERIKRCIGTADPGPGSDRTMEVRGRDLATGLPRTETISAGQVHAALQEVLAQIVSSVRSVLRRTPPELAADIMDHGIILTGGGALLEGMDRLLANATGVVAQLADDPQLCVAVGTGLALSLRGKLIAAG